MNDISKFLDVLLEIVKDASEKSNQKPPKTLEPVINKPRKYPERLTAAKIRELKWMTARQIATIYKYGKVKTVIDDDPEAIKELKWMSQGQLEALFGKEED